MTALFVEINVPLQLNRFAYNVFCWEYIWLMTIDFRRFLKELIIERRFLATFKQWLCTGAGLVWCSVPTLSPVLTLEQLICSASLQSLSRSCDFASLPHDICHCDTWEDISTLFTGTGSHPGIHRTIFTSVAPVWCMTINSVIQLLLLLLLLKFDVSISCYFNQLLSHN